MINVCLKDSNRIIKDVRQDFFSGTPHENIVWIDVARPSDEERIFVEETFGVRLLNKEEIEEIESTSKYSETSQGIVSNLTFFISKDDDIQGEPTSFIIKDDGMLISLRHTDLPSFEDTERRMEVHLDASASGSNLFVTLLEARIDKDADIIEMIARQISDLAKEISNSDSIDKNTLIEIIKLEDKIMSIRENINDLQRVLMDMRRSPRFLDTLLPRLQLMLKDVDSLINHADFSFQRLDNLQNTALGLINIEQNEIVKILSVAAVVFMPPTLVASMYGMNFKYMPELEWNIALSNGWIIPAGYLFAIGLMILFAFLTVWFFRRKKWL